MQKSDSTNMNTVSKTTYSKFIAYGPALLYAIKTQVGCPDVCGT